MKGDFNMAENYLERKESIMDNIDDLKADMSKLNRFAVLQLKEHDESTHYKRFKSLEDLKEAPTGNDYEMIYFEVGEPSVKVNANEVYARFTSDTLRPSNYYGHSMNVSDVLLTDYEGEIEAYYCDDFGFKKLDNDFLTEKLMDDFKHGFDVRKDYENLFNIAANGTGLSENEYDRLSYLENNYKPIFEMADKRAVILDNQDRLTAIREYELQGGEAFNNGITDQNIGDNTVYFKANVFRENSSTELEKLIEERFYDRVANIQIKEDELPFPEAKSYRYYSTQRPISMGTYPTKDHSENIFIENYDVKTYVESIGREAWGELRYNTPLSAKELSDYELVADPSIKLTLEERIQGDELLAEDITNIKGVDRQYNAGTRETTYTFECDVRGIHDILTYEVSQHDDGEYYTIHTENNDIWESMSEPELRKLEAVLSREATYFLWQQRIENAVTVNDLQEVRFGFMETEHSSLSQAQRELIWDGIDAKQIEIERSTQEMAQETESKEDSKNSKSGYMTLKQKLNEGIKNTLNSESFANWCEKQGRMFYSSYSLNNAMLIYLQKENATYVAGYEQWKLYGRQVQNGATGIKIFNPLKFKEEHKGNLYRIIKNDCDKQIKNGSELAHFSFAQDKASFLNFYMRKNGIFDVTIEKPNTLKKTILANANAEKLQKFIDRNIIGKMPYGYGVTTVFDISDTTDKIAYLDIAPSMKGKFDDDEFVKDKNGKPLVTKDKHGRTRYKIENSDKRRAVFNEVIDLTIKGIDQEKMEILYNSLSDVANKRGIPVSEMSGIEDENIKSGANGYYAFPTEEFPNGKIVIKEDMPIENRISTMFHELAHSDLHRDKIALNKVKEAMKLCSDEKVTRQMKEIQAEAVAFMTASNFGIETDHKAFDYIAKWNNGSDLEALQKSMDLIYFESKKLMQDIVTTLDDKGFTINLEAKNNELISSEEINKMCSTYMTKVVNDLRKNENIQTEAKTEFDISTNTSIQNIIKKQLYLTTKIEEKLNKIYELSDELKAADNKTSQINLDMQISSLNKQVENHFNEINDLSNRRIDVAIESFKSNEKTDLKSLYFADTEKLFELLKEHYDELKDLSKNDLKFLSNNEFLKKNYAKLLDNDTKQFVALAKKHLDNFKTVLSKNKTAVEIINCEQWTKEKIFSAGELLHPAKANKIIEKAEKQIENLKFNAKKNNDYFPYTKCNIAIHSIVKSRGKDTLASLTTRVDIGDSEQIDLKDHLSKILSSSKTKTNQQILDNFEKSCEENRGIKSIEPAVIENDFVSEITDTKEVKSVQTMSDWKMALSMNNNNIVDNSAINKTKEVEKE